jgi:hypothetical protein
MKTIDQNSPLKSLTALLLLFAVCLSLLISSPTRSYAKEQNIENTANKVSPEFKKFGNDYFVLAIVQLNGLMSQPLSDYIKKNSSTTEFFPNLDACAIKIKVSNLAELSSFPEVSSITLDKSVKKLGHISKTTGADAARALGGNKLITVPIQRLLCWILVLILLTSHLLTGKR